MIVDLVDCLTRGFYGPRLTGRTGSPHDAELFIAIKNWMDDCLTNLNKLTYDEFVSERDFWEELPCIVESLLRRV